MLLDVTPLKLIDSCCKKKDGINFREKEPFCCAIADHVVYTNYKIMLILSFTFTFVLPHSDFFAAQP